MRGNEPTIYCGIATDVVFVILQAEAHSSDQPRYPLVLTLLACTLTTNGASAALGLGEKSRTTIRRIIYNN